MAVNPSTQTEYAHIVRTPGVLGGEPRIAGHRIRVRDIVAARDLGTLSPEEIAASIYPDLSLAQAYAALAFYEDHRAEIDQASQNEADFAQRFLHDHPQLVRDARRHADRSIRMVVRPEGPSLVFPRKPNKKTPGDLSRGPGRSCLEGDQGS